MLKIFILLFLLPINCFAITLGSEIGSAVSFSQLETKENFPNLSKQQNNNFIFGTFYRYNWNISRIIISVKFIYDFINIDNYTNNYNVDIRYRYGTNFNFGYDIFENTSLYAILGYNLVKYFYTTEGDKKEKLDGGGIYGVGVGYSFSLSWKANLEYEIQNLEILHNLKNRLSSIKITLSYKF